MIKVPGCWDLMSVVWDELRLIKIGKANIAAVWLDIANAYGSVPHLLIFFVLRCYGVHTDIINLLKAYYNIVFSNCSPSNFQSTGISISKVFSQVVQFESNCFELL